MSLNPAGGYAFEVSDWTMLHRFLILGTESGTYYVNTLELTIDNADCVVRCIVENGEKVVAETVDVSNSGLTPKNSPAIFVLALTAKRGDEAARRAVFSALPAVCRTGTHLFEFAAYPDAMGGWGRGARKAVATWYLSKEPDALAYQLVKYRQRDGWSHADLLRLSHPQPSPTSEALMAFAANKPTGDDLPRIVERYLRAKDAATPAESAALIVEYGLPRECVRTEHLGESVVLSALLESMPLTAMLRSLGNLSATGVVAPFSDGTTRVIEELGNAEHLRRSRVHPMAIFLALTTYASGHGHRGAGRWTPVRQVIDALDAAFYSALENVTPTNQRLAIAVDVSGSMTQAVTGTPMTCATAAAAMALIVARTEPNHVIFGVDTKPVELKTSPQIRLEMAVAIVSNSISGGTDLSVPARWLASERLDVDAIVTFTDSKTWAGEQHSSEALDSYRELLSHEVRNVVASMTSTKHSIGDIKDPLTLQCVGLDATLPDIIRGFVNADI